MITSFLLKALVAILAFIATPITNLPDAAFPYSYISALGTAVANFRTLTYVVPLTYYAILGGLLGIVGFEFLYGLYKIIMWGIKKIPFIN